MNFPIVTYSIIIVCLLLFAAEQMFFPLSYSGYELFYWESSAASSIQYVTHLFLHGGIAHLLLNMLGLWMFGSAVEKTLGITVYSLLYLFSGLGAAAAYQSVSFYEFQLAIEPLVNAGFSREQLLDVFSNSQYYPQFPSSKDAIELFLTPVVGASGALYGVLVAFAFLRPNYKVIFILFPYPVAAKYFIPVLLLIDIIAGFSGYPIFGQNIAHAAHIGGAVMGCLFMLLCRLLSK